MGSDCHMSPKYLSSQEDLNPYLTHTGCGKKYPPKIFGNISTTTENFYIKFNALILCSYLCTPTKFYSIISALTKLCHIKRDHLVDFYISLEKNTKNAISLQQFDRSPQKFNVITQYLMMMQKGLSSVSAVRHIGFLKGNFLLGGAFDIHVLRHLARLCGDLGAVKFLIAEFADCSKLSA